MGFGIGPNLSLICQLTSEDIKHQLIIKLLSQAPSLLELSESVGTAGVKSCCWPLVEISLRFIEDCSREEEKEEEKRKKNNNWNNKKKESVMTD